MARCNLNEEEREAVMKSPVWGCRTGDELDELRGMFHQFLFTRKDEEGVEWHCSACRQGGWQERREKDLYRKKHNDFTKCPDCGHVVQVKNLGRVKYGSNLHETIAVNYVETDKAGAVYIESGIGFWDFDMDHDMDEMFVAKKRYYIAPGKVQCWKRNLDWNPWSQSCKAGDWETAVNVLEPFERNWLYGYDGFSVFIGLEQLERSALKYSAIQQYFSDYHDLDICGEHTPLRLVQRYLAEYAMRPGIEMAVKMGHSDIVGELVRDGRKNARYVDWNAKNPAGFCRMTKQEYNALHELLDAPTLRQYHEMKRSGQIRTTAEAETIFRNIGSGELMEKTARACTGLNVSLTEAARYLGRQGSVRGMWLDYIDMAKKLNYDLTERTVIFPKDLQARHDAAAETIKAETTEKQRKAYRARYEMLKKKYAFRMDGLEICIPEDAQQIVREGKTLHHCVGGYADRHIQGVTNILFLRRERKPGTPFVTIELDNDGNLRQIHGYKNERYPFAVRPEKTYEAFLQTWQGWYKAGSRRDMNGRPILKSKEKTA